MLLTHQLFLLILISTSETSTTSTNSASDSTDTPITGTVAVTSIPSENTTTPFTNNATTPLLSTHASNVTSPPLSTQGNVTSSSTVVPENATSSSAITPGNATASPAPVTTAAARTTSPLVPTPEDATNHPVTSPDNATTGPLPEPGNSTNPLQTTRGNDTTPISTPSNSTASPITTPSHVTITTQTTPATCPAVPCPPLGVCVNSTCQCVTGTIPLNNACVETKTFTSSLRVNRIFENAMNDPKSPLFQQTAKEIITAVNEALGNQPNYINSIVIKLMSGSIVASVNSFFEPNSLVTQESVISAMETAIRDCKVANCAILANAQYTATNLCEQALPPCDVDTTVCEAKDGTPVCTCKPGHVSSQYQARSCRVCPSGYKAQENTCVQCPFGYSGFNCDDSSLLALVVVACVLGGILLIVILAVLIYICVTRGKESSNSNYYNSPYPAEEFQATWPSQNVTHIPRATLASSSSIDATGNSLEMAEGPGRKGHINGLKIGGKSGSYDLRTDGMRTFKDINPTRYSYLMGHENPYFTQGNEKR
ncbi:protein HEG homolog 1-like isoform X8 [Sinocyclocheilus grahami]|uniref:protein HEG homolog 1-like isoform X8 n=1 Tax=Sinocyclocheilus grahami TaxID=75366 RepID=UPI0007ACD4C4|nr:PREDICTED: protein HEG homolog 1-like isoform X8 [Sinocyclocheilus grahami]